MSHVGNELHLSIPNKQVKFYLHPLSPSTSIFILHFGPLDKGVDYAYSKRKYGHC